jgi:hypothetical protein
VTLGRFAPGLVVCALVACGAATDPTLIEEPGAEASTATTFEIIETQDSAAGFGDATTAPPDAAQDGSDGSSLSLHSNDGAGGSSGGGAGDGAACTPVVVMDVPSSGGLACTASGTTCYPHDETAFSGTWVPPLPRVGRCTSTQIMDFYTSCFSSTASDAACGAWTDASANATCLGCLKTPSTAAAYGALIQFPGDVVELNEAGCVALAEPCNLECAQTWLAGIECRDAACTSTECTDQGDLIECTMTAATCTACEAYTQAAGCMTELTGPDHPAGALCAIGSENDVTLGDYTSLATFMCGM